jgi:hypothetical protein
MDPMGYVYIYVCICIYIISKRQAAEEGRLRHAGHSKAKMMEAIQCAELI